MDQNRREALINDIELAKKEIRAGALAGKDEPARNRHLADALRQLTIVIAKIQIDQVFDQAFGPEASMGA